MTSRSRARTRRCSPRPGSSPTTSATPLLSGLDQVAAELEDGTFPFVPEDVDIHMAVERRLTDLVGPVGGKLHTARSRNDQVATDLVLFTRAHADAALAGLHALRTHAGRARRAPPRLGDAGLHAPPARPARLPLAPPARVLLDAQPRRAALRVRARGDAGAAARRGRAGGRELRHRPRAAGRPSSASTRVAPNSIDAVSNRDFVLDYLGAAATCATHLSRLGAELVLWSSEEFGFCEVADAWASGSSIMPQKKNPDAAELLRAKAPRIVAHLVGLHGVMHGLPLTYNKDLQEDKEHLFDAVDTLELSLAAATGMLAGSRSTASASPRPPPTS